jgi:methylisocitrate lyase
VAALFIEDQVFPKRCGHMAGKAVIGVEEMIGKIKSALDARQDPDLVIMARTDALAVNGIDDAIERARIYREAGADLLFVEAPRSVAQMRRICREVDGPCFANNIENGLSPLLPAAELQKIGYAMVVFSLAPLMAAAHAVRQMMQVLKRDGTTAGFIDRMIDFDAMNELVGLRPMREREMAIQEQARRIVARGGASKPASPAKSTADRKSTRRREP